MSSINVIGEDPSLEHNLRGHKKAILGLSFHPLGTCLSTCSSDNSVMLWNLKSTNIRCYDFKGHNDVVNAINFASNGEYMVSCSTDQTVRLWIPTINGGSTYFKAHTAAIRDVNFSPDNEKLVTSSNDKTIKIWNAQYRKFLSSFTGHTNWVRSAQYSPDGRVIASCSDDKTIRFWDVTSNQCIHTYFNTRSGGNHVSFHRGGNSIAIAMNSGSVRIYDVRNNKLQQHYTLHSNTACVAWHPFSEYFISCGLEGTIKIVDALEGRPLYTLRGHTGPINKVQFSYDGQKFASAGNDQHIMIWKLQMGSQISAPVTESVISSTSAATSIASVEVS